MNKLAAQELIKGRERKKLTQTEMAEKLAAALSQTYSLRQYQNLEEGKFPKYKKEVVKKLDGLLGTKVYELIYEQDSPNAVSDSGDDNHYTLKNKPPEKIIEDLAASSRDHAAADLKRAEAEIIREQNHKRIIDHITGNATEEIAEAIESRFSDLLELIARLGTGTRWKNEKDAREELSKLWHGEKKVSLKDGSPQSSGK